MKKPKELIAKEGMIYEQGGDGRTIAVFYRPEEAEALAQEINDMRIMIERLRDFVMDPRPRMLGLLMDESKKFTY